MGGLARNREGDIDNYKQIDYITLEEALFKAIIYQKARSSV